MSVMARALNLKGFDGIRLSHRNIGVFGAVGRLVYRRRRRFRELSQVKLHIIIRMPRPTRSITWVQRPLRRGLAFLFSVGPGCPLRLALAVGYLFTEG